ncbi:hypothetical protein M9Y10_009647 [Tritrichomonas musculus]|uniref:Uncharacterized protein n=1 Tax=Tritrichomonas musculus TaxID=1915356 RepID=A0ABR2IP37_9EUKA
MENQDNTTPIDAQTPASDTPVETSQAQTFTLWCNNRRYDFQADLFGQKSKKAAKLIEEGQTQGVIERRVRNDAFEAFVKACNGQPFLATPNNAFELQALAFEWGVTSLEKFIEGYIQDKSLKPPPEADHLGVLIDHLEQGIDDPNDIIDVANVVNDALDDERFESVPPEIIFKILIASDQKKLEQPTGAEQSSEEQVTDHQTLDQKALIDFTLRLFETNPSSAVPLTLLIDFDQLTKDQRDKIFHCKDMHELNIGYFVAHSMSATRDKAERELIQSEAQLKTDLANLRNTLKEHQRTSVEKLRQEQDTAISQLSNSFNEHQEKIDVLTEKYKDFGIKLNQIKENQETRFDAMKEKLGAIDDSSSQRSSIASEMSDRVNEEVIDQIEKLNTEVTNQLTQLAKDNADNADQIEAALKKKVETEQARLKSLRNKLNSTVDNIKTTNETLTDVQATLAAKIVHDRLKYDKFLRNTESRFDVFNQEERIWGLSVDDVKKAEEFVVQLEDQVDQLCPVRGTSSNNA